MDTLSDSSIANNCEHVAMFLWCQLARVVLLSFAGVNSH
jgi:hypothetical protein